MSSSRIFRASCSSDRRNNSNKEGVSGGDALFLWCGAPVFAMLLFSHGPRVTHSRKRHENRSFREGYLQNLAELLKSFTKSGLFVKNSGIICQCANWPDLRTFFARPIRALFIQREKQDFQATISFYRHVSALLDYILAFLGEHEVDCFINVLVGLAFPVDRVDAARDRICAARYILNVWLDAVD